MKLGMLISNFLMSFWLYGCAESQNRYVHIGNGQCLHDTETGLIWELKTDDGGLRDKSHTYSWYSDYSNGGHPGWQDSAIGYSHKEASVESAPKVSGDSCNRTLTYCNTQDYIAAVNEIALCGYQDWRLPGMHELSSIIDKTRPGCAEGIGSMDTGGCIDPRIFPHTGIDRNGDFGGYWSSTPSERSSEFAWSIYFRFGDYGSYFKYHNNYIRLVRSFQI